MGFVPDGDFQNIGSNNNDLQIVLYASAPDKFSNIVDSFEQPDCSFQLRDTSESVPKSPLRSNFATCTEQIDNKQCSTPYVAKKDLRVYDGSYNPQLGKMQLPTEHGNLLLRPSTCGYTFANTASLEPPVISSKARIWWTQDLQEKFVECVKCLGGSERATPKAILKLMNSDGLSIFHVKSRLQVNSAQLRENLEKTVGRDGSAFNGLDLATLIRKKYGRSYDVQLIKKLRLCCSHTETESELAHQIVPQWDKGPADLFASQPTFLPASSAPVDLFAAPVPTVQAETKPPRSEPVNIVHKEPCCGARRCLSTMILE